jgi:hypothetical protein
VDAYIPVSSALANKWLSDQYITVSMSVSGNFFDAPFSYNSGNFITNNFYQGPCPLWDGFYSGGGDGWIVSVSLYNVGSNYYISYVAQEFLYEGLITNLPLVINPSIPPYCSQFIGSTTATVGGNIVNSYGCTRIPVQTVYMDTMTISLT